MAYMPANQLSSSIVLRMIEAPFCGCPSRDKANDAATRTAGSTSPVVSIKALLASAKVAERMRRAPEFGIESVDVTVDTRAVMTRVRSIRQVIGATESPEALARHGVDVAFGGARFLDPERVQVGDGRRVRAARFLIATGSRPVVADIPGIDGVDALTNEGLFELDELPTSMAVLGGGPIGCEMAQALHRLGSSVTLVHRGERILQREEPEVSQLIGQRFSDEGIDVRLRASATSVTRVAGGCRLTLTCGDSIEAASLLVATGRKPNLAALQLDRADVSTTARGVEVRDDLRTTNPRVYAAGDCTGGPQFTHWAEYEARIATRNALFRGRAKRDLRVVPWTTFTDPEVARVGLTLADAEQQNVAAHIHDFPFSEVERAVCDGDQGGFLRAVLDGRDRVLGVHIVGAHAGELLPEWVEAVQARRKLAEIAARIHVYPTLSHGSRRLADQSFLIHGVSRWTRRLFGRFESIRSWR